MGRTILTRAQLHELVWAKPLRTVAGELGISDVGLAKICKRHDIPTPPQGHWTRVQMGKPGTSLIALPAAGLGQGDEIEIVAGVSAATGGEVLQPDEHARRELLLTREAQPEFCLEVRSGPATLHPIAARVQKVLRSAKIDDYDCLRCSDPALPAVRVTPGGVARAVALVDALARGADMRSFRWQTGRGNRWDNLSSLVIADIAFPIEIYEVVDRRPHELTPEEKAKQAKGQLYWKKRYDFFGTDRFSIRRHEYEVYLKDAKRERIEDRLNGFFSILIVKAFETREENRRRAIAEDLAEQRALRQAEIKRLQEVEKAEVAALDAHAANWRKAQDLRALIDAVRTSDLPSCETLDRWLVWAQSQADRIDPLRDRLGQLLEVDFESLTTLRKMVGVHGPRD